MFGSYVYEIISYTAGGSRLVIGRGGLTFGVALDSDGLLSSICVCL